MNRYITSMYGNKIFLPLLSLCLFSCVYFNTFYNAENSFKQANEIIDATSSYNNSNNDIPTNAKKLLRESISSSNIVINEYAESKYVDDAIYYMARSYFSLSEFYKAEKYFTQIVQNHTNSPYYYESKLWLEYTYFKLNELDSIISNVKQIEDELKTQNYKKNKDLLFLLYNLKGDYYIETNDMDKGFIQYEKALEYVSTKSKKVMIYSKLAFISESKQMYQKSADYLDLVQNFSIIEETKIDAFRKWLEMMKKIKNYDKIISKIQNSINSSEFDSEKLKDEFNMELAIAYMYNKEFSKSKVIFLDIINSSNQRQIKCESYYWLGHISLMHEFDLELAKEYFDLVLETMRTSDFSKKTKEYLNEMKSYDKLINEYNLNNEEDMPIIDEDKLNRNSNEFINKKIQKDSLLFIIAEKLYFDFSQTKKSIDKHSELINKYPDSKYISRSNNIINKLRGSDDYIISANIDSIKFLRDSAWSLFDYDKQSSVNMFLEIAQKYSDYQSYYSLGIIYENHLYQPELGIKYYIESFINTDDKSFRSVLKNKLLLLEESIKSKIDTIEQKNSYVNGLNFIIEDFNLDSAIFYFNISNKLNESNELKLIIDNYIKNINDIDFKIIKDSIIIENWKHKKYSKVELDSILFSMANTSFWYFKNIDLSQKYMEVIFFDDTSKQFDSFSKLQRRIKQNDFKFDSSNTQFNEYFLKSEQYFNFYNLIDDSQYIYKDDILKYNNLLNYFSENLHDNIELDSIKLGQQKTDKMEIINNSIPVINGNKMIPIDLDIKIDNEQ
ncbi:MAG: tetratricopeptide repeat protein [Candidatus Neomarinimicrobiota bacterium]